MGIVLINDSTLTSIADAIREKTGETETYKPAEMPQAILSIVGDGGDINTELFLSYNSNTLTEEQIQMLLDSIGAATSHGSIRNYLFYMAYEAIDIVIPDTIAYIGSHAFESCTNLEKVKISNVIENIHENAFAYTGLTTVTLPTSLSNLGRYAFFKCESLKTVYFEGKPRSIHKFTFNGCNALTDIYVPWAEGEVADAPWGATNATIHYNYKE